MNNLSFLFLLFYSVSSFACICNNYSFKEDLDWANEVFIGRLIEIKEIETNKYPSIPNEKITNLWYAKFEVLKKWKGSNKKIIKIYQDNDACKVNFSEMGAKFLIFAGKNKLLGEKLTTNTCRRNYQYFNHLENEPDTDNYKLDKLFKNTIKLSSSNYVVLKPKLYYFLIFLSGLVLGVFLTNY